MICHSSVLRAYHILGLFYREHTTSIQGKSRERFSDMQSSIFAVFLSFLLRATYVPISL